jgi:sugar phosphate isomerase/epimerase
MTDLKVGVDSYSLKPLDLSPFELLEWAVINEADGVQFSEVNVPPGQALDKIFLGELRSYAEENRLYVEWGGGEHIPLDLATGKAKDIAAGNRKAAEQAFHLGSSTVRSCSGGLMRWKKDSPPTDDLLRLMAAALRDQKPMLRDYGVILAIETHFEFTSFELLRLFEMCDAQPGDWLGVCLDTMNLMTMIEHPAWATERLLPWVVSTHMKDGGVLMGRDGLTTFPVPIGAGTIDLEGIIQRLDTLPRPVHLSVEDHGGSFLLPIHDEAFLSRFPDLTGAELAALVNLSEVTAGRPACRPVERTDWPAICESRITHDIEALGALARSVPIVAGGAS